MKTAISKDQSTELRKWFEKHRVPKNVIDDLLNSKNASNTYKAYRLKKQINTADGWIIHFGANWARQAEKPSPSNLGSEAPKNKSATELESLAISNDESSKDIKTIGEDFLSRTFMGLAEKLKKLKIEDVDKPQMQKIALEIDKDHLAMLKKYAEQKDVTVGTLVRLAIRNMLEKI